MAIKAAGFNCNCDVCDRFLHVPAMDEASARRLIALHGWEMGSLDLCKTCVEKRDAGVAGILLLIQQRSEQKAVDGG